MSLGSRERYGTLSDGVNVVKLYDSLLTCAKPERFRDVSCMCRNCTNPHLLYLLNVPLTGVKCQFNNAASSAAGEWRRIYW